MIDLREHKDLIRELVTKEAEKDTNWKWSIKRVSKTVVHIRWGYLEYIGEDAMFSITTEHDDDYLGDTVTWRHPSSDMISFATIGTRPGDNAESVQQAIEMAVRGIAGYAHSRY